MAIIAIEGIGKVYRSGRQHVPVLQDVHLQVAAGEVLGLLGPNGAGKTTLIKILTGLLRPDEGGGTVLGFDLLRQHHSIRAHVSLVSTTADVGTDNNLTVRQNLAFWAPIYGLYGQAARTRIDELLVQLDLLDKVDAWPMHISAGQRQRLALARALLARHPLVFLDEPTNKLDFAGVQSVRTLIAQMNREEGVTIVLTTHVMEEAEELCGTIALLHQGRLIACQPTQELTHALHLTRPVTLTVAGLPLVADGAELRHLPGVSAVHPITWTGERANITVDSVDLRATTPALLAWVRARQLALVSMHAEAVTLRDVFVSLTGKGAAR